MTIDSERSPRPRVGWRASANIAPPAAEIELREDPDGDGIRVRARVEAREDLWGWVVLDIVCPQSFGVGLYENGVVQRAGDHSGWIGSAAPLLHAYTVSRDRGSAWVTPSGPATAVTHWSGEDSSFGVSLVVWGETSVHETWVDGPFDPSTALRPARMLAGSTHEVEVTVRFSAASVTDGSGGAVTIPHADNRRAHQLAVWGSQAPSLGSLELPGSAYPTINLPARAYGPLHTFFDPDAWSVAASLSFSGMPFLHAQARSVIDRAIDGIREDGLVPHHFAHDEVEYLAISGSPQPGPNLFLVEAVVDSACADGDLAWLRATWSRGLRAACEWTLSQFDEERNLLCVTGALWVDVFRRAGFTLDTNAMAVRTLVKAAEIADLLNDDLGPRLRDVASRIRDGLASLWSDEGDHFVTSRSADWSTVDDHLDAENYLAIATGAASDSQARAIFERFDSAPQFHPGDRGTFVSLRRYEPADCYLENTGDSDISMARLWWADLMARHRMGDREGFLRYFNPIRSDLLQSVWMRERYDDEGRPTRAAGYHEYPDLLDMLIREAYYGISLSVSTAEVAPLVEESFTVRFGDVALDYSPDRVVFVAPSLTTRTVLVRGLSPSSDYVIGDRVVRSDRAGTVCVDGVGERLELIRT